MPVDEKFDGRRKTVGRVFDFTAGSAGAYVAKTTGLTVEYVLQEPVVIGSGSTATPLTGIVTLDDALDAMYQWLSAEGLTAFEGLELETLTGSVLREAIEEGGTAIFELTATYSRLSGAGGDSGGDGGDTFTFDTTGGTQRITQSISTVSSSKEWLDTTSSVESWLPGNAGAIGVNGETVEGCDIVVPQYQFTLAVTIDDVDTAYKLAVLDLTGTVNDAPFAGFEAGEVLFLGARGQRVRRTTTWQIEFQFAVSRNKTNIVVTPEITVPEKKGWDYIWFTYGQRLKQVRDAGDGSLVAPGEPSDLFLTVPVSYSVEQVYRPGDFTLLLIPPQSMGDTGSTP